MENSSNELVCNVLQAAKTASTYWQAHIKADHARDEALFKVCQAAAELEDSELELTAAGIRCAAAKHQALSALVRYRQAINSSNVYAFLLNDARKQLLVAAGTMLVSSVLTEAKRFDEQARNHAKAVPRISDLWSKLLDAEAELVRAMEVQKIALGTRDQAKAEQETAVRVYQEALAITTAHETDPLLTYALANALVEAVLKARASEDAFQQDPYVREVPADHKL